MSDNVRGERRLTIGGKDYRIKFSINAVCELELELAMGVDEIGAKLAAGGASVRTVRGLLWAGLLEYRPAMTVLEAGKLMDVIAKDPKGAETAGILTEALLEAFAQDDTADPQKPARRRRGRTSGRARSS